MSVSRETVLAPQPISIDCLREKYCAEGESSIEDVQRRVARALSRPEADAATWEHRFFVEEAPSRAGAVIVLTPP